MKCVFSAARLMLSLGLILGCGEMRAQCFIDGLTDQNGQPIIRQRAGDVINYLERTHGWGSADAAAFVGLGGSINNPGGNQARLQFLNENRFRLGGITCPTPSQMPPPREDADDEIRRQREGRAVAEQRRQQQLLLQQKREEEELARVMQESQRMAKEKKIADEAARRREQHLRTHARQGKGASRTSNQQEREHRAAQLAQQQQGSAARATPKTPRPESPIDEDTRRAIEESLKTFNDQSVVTDRRRMSPATHASAATQGPNERPLRAMGTASRPDAAFIQEQRDMEMAIAQSLDSDLESQEKRDVEEAVRRSSRFLSEGQIDRREDLIKRMRSEIERYRTAGKDADSRQLSSILSVVKSSVFSKNPKDNNYDTTLNSAIVFLNRIITSQDEAVRGYLDEVIDLINELRGSPQNNFPPHSASSAGTSRFAQQSTARSSSASAYGRPSTTAPSMPSVRRSQPRLTLLEQQQQQQRQQPHQAREEAHPQPQRPAASGFGESDQARMNNEIEAISRRVGAVDVSARDTHLTVVNELTRILNEIRTSRKISHQSIHSLGHIADMSTDKEIIDIRDAINRLLRRFDIEFSDVQPSSHRSSTTRTRIGQDQTMSQKAALVLSGIRLTNDQYAGAISQMNSTVQEREDAHDLDGLIARFSQIMSEVKESNALSTHNRQELQKIATACEKFSYNNTSLSHFFLKIKSYAEEFPG